MILCCTVSLVTSEFQYIVEWNENIQHLNYSSPLWTFGSFFGSGLLCFLPPITPFSYCCMPIFGIEQSGSILLHFVLSSVPRLSNGPSSSRTSFYNVFLDSGVTHPYYMPSPLVTFNAHVTHATISVLLCSLYSSSLYHLLQTLLTYTCFSMLLNHFCQTNASFVWHCGKTSMFRSCAEQLV